MKPSLTLPCICIQGYPMWIILFIYLILYHHVHCAQCISKLEETTKIWFVQLDRTFYTLLKSTLACQSILHFVKLRIIFSLRIYPETITLSLETLPWLICISIVNCRNAEVFSDLYLHLNCSWLENLCLWCRSFILFLSLANLALSLVLSQSEKSSDEIVFWCDVFPYAEYKLSLSWSD